MKCNLTLEMAETLTEFRPEKQVGQIAPRPTLFIHGADDRQVPSDESRHMFMLAGEPRQLEIVPNMGHFDWTIPRNPGFVQVTDIARHFLEENLLPQ